MNSKRNKRCCACDKEKINPEKRRKMALYLEDNTPIRTIEVSNIGDNISAEYLRGYFELAAGGGRVVDVRIVGSGTVAYVTFLLPEDAAMVLSGENLSFESRFTIKQADTAYQPKIDQTILKIEDVNDDCLLHIASYLRPMDLVNLGQTSKRLKSIVVSMYQKQSHFSAIRDKASSVTKEVLPIVLQDMGPYIRSISWRVIGQPQLQYLTEHCSNVCKLKLQSPSLSSYDIKTNKTFFKSIHNLELRDCSSLYDKSMKIVITSSHLKQLQLINCRKMQGKFFNQWKNCELKHLKIEKSPAVRSVFLSLCTTGRFNTLIQLNLDCNGLAADKIESLQSLQNVRFLTLSRVDNRFAERVYSALHMYLPQIESLKMFTKNEDVNLKSISNMVSSLANLKSFSHSLMTWELLQLIRRARELGKQSPIEIIIPREMFNDPKKAEMSCITAILDTTSIQLVEVMIRLLCAKVESNENTLRQIIFNLTRPDVALCFPSSRSLGCRLIEFHAATKHIIKLTLNQ